MSSVARVCLRRTISPVRTRALSTISRPALRSRHFHGAWIAGGVGLLALHIALSSPIRADAPPSTQDRIEPASKLSFPTRLRSDALGGSRTLELCGLGIRKVSFLRVQVYAMGLYVDPSAAARIASLPTWKGLTRDSFLAADGEGFLGSVLDAPSDALIRIVTTRPTEWSHLRDGWTRAITNRLKIGTKAGTISEAEAEAVANSGIDALKSMFSKGQVPKGGEIRLIRRGSDGALLVEYENKVVGTVSDPILSRELFLAYVSSHSVISPSLRESIADGLTA